MVAFEKTIEVVEKVINRQAKIQIFSGVFILMVFTSLWIFNRESLFVSIASILGIISGALLIYHAAKKLKYNNSSFEKSIRLKRKEIVWVYHHVTQIMPFGIFLFEKYSLYIHLLNGKSYVLRGKKSEIIFIKRGLEKMLDKASFGYSVEKEQLYKANPVLLINE